MSHNFADRLTASIRQHQSRVIVGLDPDFRQIPQSVKELAARASSTQWEAELWAIREFCEKIVAATSAYAAGFKPQIAFFERYGPDGLQVLQRILQDHEPELFIVDCKRGDIGNTCEAYARAYFHLAGDAPAPLPADAVTHNPYLGEDSIKPYYPYMAADKGMFLLAKTSNPSSGDFQDLTIKGAEGWPEEPLAERVARQAARWGEAFVGESGYSSLGIVVGATYPESARVIREIAPKAYILVPGLDSQGGKLDDARHFVNADGHGAIYNFARAVIYAYKSDRFSGENGDAEYGKCAAAAAEYYRDSLNEALGKPA